jgi:N-acetylmuramoyl-L-alanine amidase
MRLLPTPRSKDTLDLIRQFRTERARRRRLQVVGACLGGAVVLALFITLVFLVLGGSDSQEPSGSTTSSSLAGVDVSPTTSTSTTTTALISPTTLPSPATTASVSAAPTAPPSGGFVVVIDPGHQGKADYELEPVGPGSSEMKARVSSGTRSVNTGTPESGLVLTIGLKLRDSLQARGIQVVMTRTIQEVSISNSERAQLANASGADLFVRLHCDGSSDPAIRGIHVLYPVSIPGWTDDIAAESKQAASMALNELIAATGANDRGLNARRDMTGFNWSDVPVFLPELGFMTNVAEDALLATAEYQDKIVQALTRAILSYLEVS